jgi:hypothetical protein
MGLRLRYQSEDGFLAFMISSTGRYRVPAGMGATP